MKTAFILLALTSAALAVRFSEPTQHTSFSTGTSNDAHNLDVDITERGGRGTMLFLHGAGGHKGVFSDAHRAAPAGKVIVPTLRGYGDSSQPAAAEDMLFPKQAGDIVELIRKEAFPSVGGAIVVAHSQGGFIWRQVWQQLCNPTPILNRVVARTIRHVFLLSTRLDFHNKTGSYNFVAGRAEYWNSRTTDPTEAELDGIAAIPGLLDQRQVGRSVFDTMAEGTRKGTLASARGTFLSSVYEAREDYEAFVAALHSSKCADHPPVDCLYGMSGDAYNLEDCQAVCNTIGNDKCQIFGVPKAGHYTAQENGDAVYGYLASRVNELYGW